MSLAQRLQTLATGRGRKALVVAAAFALVLAIGYTLAALVWLLVDGVPTTVAPTAAPAMAAMPQRAYTPETAAGWTLFGDAAAVPAADSNQPVPQTNLALQLLGIFSAADAKLAGAVIAERGKDGELFRVGAALPGGATLEKVDKNEVLLRRRGQLEVLRFDAFADGSATESARPRAGGVPASSGGLRELRANAAMPSEAPSGRELVNRFAEDFKAAPDIVLNDIGLKTAAGGGYSVGEGAAGDMLRGLGLRPGDVVLSVNGKPLGNPDADAGMIDEVKGSGEARVEIRRGSQTFTVNYPL